EKSGYEDFMLKEIHEQPVAIRDALRGRFDGAARLVLDDLRMPEAQIEDVDKVFVVACGTAFHAGLVGKYAIEHWTRLPVEIEIAEYVDLLRALPEQVEQALNLEPQIRELAPRYREARDFFFIGRHTGYPSALEGALKLKEISYIHAEGFPAAELKHGPIALIEEGVPVMAVATECHVYPKILSNIQEVKARGAEVIAVATEGDDRIADL